ncbi:hypothetical protein AQV86_02830 [Nanohaloarchaea archaeon SG9]|nr:hypothetical protein AQV86_02830 [Nanohaloarchaea archaeon SG9]
MNQEQLRKKIQHSLREGFTEEEVRQVLRQQGIKHSNINQAFKQIQNQQKGQRNKPNRNQRQNNQKNQQNNQRPQQNNRRTQNRGQNNQGQGFQQSQGLQQDQEKLSQNRSPGTDSGNSTGDEFLADQRQETDQNSQQGQNPQRGSMSSGLDLTDSYYRIRQHILLKRYGIYDKNDKKVLKAKKKILSIKTNIPFFKPENGEEPVFRVISSRFPNISNNYKVRDEQKDDVMAVLDRKRTLLNQVWRIRDPQDKSIVATVYNESTMLQLLRSYGGIIPLLPNVFALIPHTYSVDDVSDNQIGELEGELSIRDEYDLNLHDSGQLERRDMISSIIAIDALEGN